MAIKEIYGSRPYTLSLNGGNAQRVFHCTPEEANYCVSPFEAFPKAPQLRCRQITVTPITPNTATNKRREANLVEVVAEYAAIQAEDDTPTINIEAGGRVLETGLGRKWESNGKYVEQATGVFYATLIYNISFTVEQAPLWHIQNSLNKVNSRTFMACPPETLLFENATIDRKYDWELGIWKDRVTYRFNWQPCPWNVCWRAPQIAKNVDGSYVTDENGQYVYLDEGGWDRMVPDSYMKWDFNPLFGWPPVQALSSSDPAQIGAGFGGQYAMLVKEDKWREFLNYKKPQAPAR